MDRAGASTATAEDADDLRSDLAAIDAMLLSELISVEALDGGSVLGSALRRIREQSERERHEISAFGSYIS